MSRFVLVDERGEPPVRHVLHSGMTIGCGHCDVKLSEQGIARRHALIEHFSSGFAIRDLGSRHGVLVNDRRVDTRRTLARGDRVAIGPVTLLVDTVEAPAPIPAGDNGAALPAPEPVPDEVLARLASQGEFPLEFPTAGRRSRKSVATSARASAACFAILTADAVALAFYLAGN